MSVAEKVKPSARPRLNKEYYREVIVKPAERLLCALLETEEKTKATALKPKQPARSEKKSRPTVHQ